MSIQQRKNEEWESKLSVWIGEVREKKDIANSASHSWTEICQFLLLPFVSYAGNWFEHYQFSEEEKKIETKLAASSESEYKWGSGD